MERPFPNHLMLGNYSIILVYINMAIVFMVQYYHYYVVLLFIYLHIFFPDHKIRKSKQLVSLLSLYPRHKSKKYKTGVQQTFYE